MLKVLVCTATEGILGQEEVICDDYFVGESFVVFEKSGVNFLCIPTRYITRLEYIGEHTESAPEVL